MKINVGALSPQLSLSRRIEVSQTEFETTLPPVSETVDLCAPQFLDWFSSPSGRTVLARALCQRVDEREARTAQAVFSSQSLNGEGYVDSDSGSHRACELVQEGVVRSAAETVYFRDFTQGHEGWLSSRRRTEVHCSAGRVVILEYTSEA